MVSLPSLPFQTVIDASAFDDVFLCIGDTYMVERIELAGGARIPRVLIPVVPISQSGTRTSFTPGYYFEPRQLPFRDAPIKPQTERQISFAAMIFGHNQDEVIDLWSTIGIRFEDAQKASGPYGHGEPVTLWTRIKGTGRYTIWEVTDGHLDAVELTSLNGFYCYGALCQLRCSDFPFSEPYYLPTTAVLANGSTVWIPKQAGDEEARVRFEIDTFASVSGHAPNRLRVGRRSYRSLAATDFHPFISPGSPQTQTAGPAPVLLWVADAPSGRVENGLFDTWAVLNDAAQPVEPPQNLTAQALLTGGFLPPDTYDYVMTSVNGSGQESALSGAASVQNLGHPLAFLETFQGGKLSDGWTTLSHDGLGPLGTGTSGFSEYEPESAYLLNGFPTAGWVFGQKSNIQQATITSGGSSAQQASQPPFLDPGLGQHCIERLVPTTGLTQNYVLAAMLIAPVATVISYPMTLPTYVAPHFASMMVRMTDGSAYGVHFVPAPATTPGWYLFKEAEGISTAIFLTGPITVPPHTNEALTVWEFQATGTSLFINLNNHNLYGIATTALIAAVSCGLPECNGVTTFVLVQAVAIDSSPIGTRYLPSGENLLAFNPGANAVSYNVYWQSTSQPWHKITGVTGTSYAHTAEVAGNIFLTGPPTGPPPIGHALVRQIAAMPNSTTLIPGEWKECERSNGIDELLYLGPAALPPIAHRRGGEPERPWQQRFEILAGGPVGATVTLKAVLHLPRDTDESYFEATCPGTIAPSRWIIDFRTDGYASFELQDTLGNTLDFGFVSGDFGLWPGENILCFFFENGIVGGFYPDLANIKFTVKTRIQARAKTFIGRR